MENRKSRINTADSIFILLGFAQAGLLLGCKTFLIDQIDPAE